LFAEQLEVEVPSASTDLIDAGLLDSLKFVELLLYLEQKFGVYVDLNELELDHFRSVQGIAELVAQRMA
jgi:acyl carrier protein